jgi:hypothetical protein
MTKKTLAARKAIAKKTSQRPGLVQKSAGAPANEQDPKRRLGNFSGAGEHPRKGSRTAGIIGQTKKRNHTDRRSDS